MILAALRRAGVDRLGFKGSAVLAAALSPPKASTMARVPTSRWLCCETAADEADKPDRPEVDDWAECPLIRDCGRWNFEMGAPLSDTVSS